MPNKEPLSDASVVQEISTVRFYKFNGVRWRSIKLTFIFPITSDQLTVNGYMGEQLIDVFNWRHMLSS